LVADEPDVIKNRAVRVATERKTLHLVVVRRRVFESKVARHETGRARLDGHALAERFYGSLARCLVEQNDHSRGRCPLSNEGDKRFVDRHALHIFSGRDENVRPVDFRLPRHRIDRALQRRECPVGAAGIHKIIAALRRFRHTEDDCAHPRDDGMMALKPEFPVGILAHLTRQSQRPWEVEMIFRAQTARV
jgi:hypothetical protein